MSINHLVNPNINPRLDIYVKSLTLSNPPQSSSEVIEFDNNIFAPGGFITVTSTNDAVAEITPCKYDTGSGVVDTTLVTMNFSGTVDILNLPSGSTSTFRVTVLPSTGIPFPVRFSSLSGYISTTAGSLAAGDVLCQNIPIDKLELVPGFPQQFDITIAPAQIVDDGFSYTASNQPYSIKVSYVTS